jgi:putative ABC transport system ATP-binding protein
VAENVSLAQRLAGRSVARAEHGEVLERLGIAHRANARPSRLSGGELARAGLGVALANDPVVLLADEPTGELDDETAAIVLDLLADRTASGSAVVVVTHDRGVAERADREVALRDGEVQA